MSSYSTGTVPSCGYCGKPVINAAVYHLGVAYHPECTRGVNANAPRYYAATPEFYYEQRIADLQRQLAEAKAEIEADDRNVNNLMDQVHEMSKEIEAVQPMIEACRARYERHNLIAKGYPTETGEIDPCQCLTCQWYREYLERKQT